MPPRDISENVIFRALGVQPDASTRSLGISAKLVSLDIGGAAAAYEQAGNDARMYAFVYDALHESAKKWERYEYSWAAWYEQHRADRTARKQLLARKVAPSSATLAGWQLMNVHAAVRRGLVMRYLGADGRVLNPW